MTTREVLTAARRLLVEHGWCQMQYERCDGKLCIVGAVRRVVPLKAVALLENEAYLLLERAIGSPPVAWNDAPGRTREEVLAAFSRAIDLASEEERDA